jgi:glycosyltransferase involved in cell wall biosynthesis
MNSPATVPVSAVVPCHDSAATVERALASVLGQTCPPAELIVVDDASADGGETRRRIRAACDTYSGPIRITVIEHKTNLGAAAARNAGWNAATQKYVAFLDADDAWDAPKLEVQCGWMERHPSAAMSGHLHREMAEDPARGASPPQAAPAQIGARRITRRRLLFSNTFATRTVMLRRELQFRFDERFRRSDDYLLWLRIVHGGGEAWIIESVLAYSFKAAYGEAGLSANLWAMERSELAVYGELARQGTISLSARWLLSLYSLLKHARRVAERAFATSQSQASQPHS